MKISYVYASLLIRLSRASDPKFEKEIEGMITGDYSHFKSTNCFFSWRNDNFHFTVVKANYSPKDQFNFLSILTKPIFDAGTDLPSKSSQLEISEIVRLGGITWSIIVYTNPLTNKFGSYEATDDLSIDNINPQLLEGDYLIISMRHIPNTSTMLAYVQPSSGTILASVQSSSEVDNFGLLTLPWYDPNQVSPILTALNPKPTTDKFIKMEISFQGQVAILEDAVSINAFKLTLQDTTNLKSIVAVHNLDYLEPPLTLNPCQGVRCYALLFHDKVKIFSEFEVKEMKFDPLTPRPDGVFSTMSINNDFQFAFLYRPVGSGFSTISFYDCRLPEGQRNYLDIDDNYGIPRCIATSRETGKIGIVYTSRENEIRVKIYKANSDCSTPCSKCSGIFEYNCLECSPGNILQPDFTCGCPSRYFYDVGRNQCINCETIDTKALTCNATDSLSCEENYYLQNEDDKWRCKDSCPSGTFKGLGVCETCINSCETCLSATHCLKCKDSLALNPDNTCKATCPDGYTKVEEDGYFTCGRCKEPCDLCDTSTNDCKSCLNSFLLFNDPEENDEGSCHQTCPERSIFDSGTNSCLPCPRNCKECSSTEVCTKCKNKYELKEGRCEKNCEDKGYFDFDIGDCVSCGPGCSKCDGPEECLKCEKKHVLDTKREKGCIKEDDCETGDNSHVLLEPYGIYQSKVCAKCEGNCLTCEVEVDSCLSCQPNFYLTASSECVSDCPPSHLKREDPPKCLKCTFSCLTCDFSIYRCTSCKQNSNLQFLNTVLRTCEAYKTCDGSSVLNKDTNQCDLCASPCSSCFFSVDTCTSCIDGYDLVGETCLQVCLPGEIRSGTSCAPCADQDCHQCSGLGPNTCEVCDPGSDNKYLRLETNTCHSECPPGFFPDGNNICSQCPFDFCSTCDENKCHLCDSDHFLFQDGCYESCPDQYYSDSTNTCRKCQLDNCSKCPNDPLCDKCLMGFILHEGECKSSCPEGLYPGEISCEECSENSPFCSNCLSRTQCLQCSKGYFLQPVSSSLVTCSQCKEGCLDCFEEDYCVECREGLFLVQADCIEKCPEGKYVKEENGFYICDLCKEECSGCSSLEVCTGCSEEYSLEEEGFCKKKCSDGFAWNFPNICEECVGCPSCLDITKVCFYDLNFVFYQQPRRNFYDQGEDIHIIIGLIFTRQDGDLLNLGKIKNKKLDKEIFSFEFWPENDNSDKSEIKSFTLFWNQEGNLNIGIEFVEYPEAGKYILRAKGDGNLTIRQPSAPESRRELQSPSEESTPQSQEDDSSEPIFSIDNKEYELTIQVAPKPESETVQNVKKTAKGISSANSISGSAANYVSMVGAVVSMDPTGLVLKFSQMMKLTSRLRVINVDYGEILESFLDSQAQAFDSPRNYESQKVFYNQIGFKGKFSHKKISLNYLIQTFPIGYISVVAITLQYLSYLLISYMNFFKTISSFLLTIIVLQKKIDFVLFNLVSMDVAFYGSRFLLHSNYSYSSLDLIFTVLAYVYCISTLTKICRSCYGLYNKNEEPKKNEKLNESGFKLTVYESDTNYMSKIQRRGFAIRPYFWDHELKQVMSEKKAKNIGYVKVPVFKNTFAKSMVNLSIINYAMGDLKDDPKIRTSRLAVMSNFFFIARIFSYQMILASLPFNPCFQMTLLIVIELAYMVINIRNYAKLKHFKAVHLFIGKVTQSVFLLIFLFSTFSLSLKDPRDLSPVPEALQYFVMYSVIAGVFIEYVFLVVGLILLVVNIVKEFRKKDEKKSGGGLVVYKWVRKRFVKGYEQSLNKVFEGMCGQKAKDEHEELMDDFMSKFGAPRSEIFKMKSSKKPDITEPTEKKKEEELKEHKLVKDRGRSKKAKRGPVNSIKKQGVAPKKWKKSQRNLKPYFGNID